MDIKNAFGRALRDLRVSKGISQEALSEAGVSRVYISELERGLKNPTLATIDSLARRLGTHPLELLSKIYRYMDIES